MEMGKYLVGMDGTKFVGVAIAIGMGRSALSHSGI
jgi:hypothetical protein